MRDRNPSSTIRFLRTLSFTCAGASLIGLLLLSAPSRLRGSSLPLRVVNSETGELPASGVVRLGTGESPTVTVSQKEKSFVPATLEIHVGQTIAIVNDDTTVHNAYCSAGEFKYNSGPQQPCSTSSLVFTAPGSYDVRCAIHPKMRLTVVVTP